ncbi:hypothetical protein AADM20_17160, partial [Erwinia amylovora]
DSAGNFVCDSASSSWRRLPVWTTDASALCQQQQQQVQQQQHMLQQQDQQPQQQNQQKDANGVAGWIKDMFGQ